MNPLRNRLMRCARLAVAVAVVVWPPAARPLAHHSISAVYDSQQAVTIEGVVAKFAFVNPHPYVIVTASEAGRAPEPWQLEMDNRRELSSIGMTADTLKPGDRVVVTGSRSRTSMTSLYVRKLVRSADGFEYEQVGSRPRINRR